MASVMSVTERHYHVVTNKLYWLVKGNVSVNHLHRAITQRQTPESSQIHKLSQVYVYIDICTGWAKKTGLFLRSDNFAVTNDRKACNVSKVSEFCLA